MKMMSSGKVFDVLKVGKLTPKLIDVDCLEVGEVGVLAGSVKEVADTRVGDTITDPQYPATQALSGFQKAKQMVFGGIFPIDASDFPHLRTSLDKLTLNDSSLIYEAESSSALGFGFRVGFLGLLHMDIVQERLEREYNLNLIFTAPTVVYKVYTHTGDEVRVENPSKLPSTTEIERIEEPYVAMTIHTPEEFCGSILKLLTERRGIQKNLEYPSSRK